MKYWRFWAKIARFLAFLEAAFMVAIATTIVAWNPHLRLNEAMISLLLLMIVLASSILALIGLSRFVEGKA